MSETLKSRDAEALEGEIRRTRDRLQATLAALAYQANVLARLKDVLWSARTALTGRRREKN